VATLAAGLLTWRLWPSLGQRVVSGNPDDVALFSWYLKHTAWSVIHGHNPFLYTTMNAPVGVNGMWNTTLVLPGVIMTPITLLAGPVVSYNVLFVASFVGAAVAAFVLIKRFVASNIAAGIGAFVYAFSPAMVTAGLGHLSLVLSTALTPVVLLLIRDAVTGKRSPFVVGALLGVTGAAQILIGEEMLFEAAIAATIALLILALNRPKHVLRRLPRLLRVAVVAVAITVALDAYPLWLQFFGPLHQHGSPFTLLFFVADLRGFIVPSSRYWVASLSDARFAAAYGGGAPEYLAYLGAPLIVAMVAIAVWRVRDLRVRVVFLTAACLALASLGGTLLINGRHTQVHLPWGLVEHWRVFEGALPDRFALLVALAAGTLLAMGSDRLLSIGNVSGRVACLLLAMVILAPIVPKPYQADRVPPVPAFFSHAQRWIASGSTVVLLPFPDALHTEPLYWQAASNMRFRIPGGYFIGPASDGHPFIGGPGPRPTAQLFLQIGESGQVPEVTAGVRQQLLDDLAYWDADYIVLAPGPASHALLTFVRTAMHQNPQVAEDVFLWAVSR
jgi:hypothetical protein